MNRDNCHARVVVSFTTIPSRIAHIKPMMESIVIQTYKPDRIVLWLPDICLKQGIGYNISEDMLTWIKDNDIEIGQCGKDWGSPTKLIPALMSEKDPDTIIITVDDDSVYEKHAIEELVEGAKENPSASIGFMGLKGKRFLQSELRSVKQKYREVHLLGGYRGILYRRGFFEDDIFEILDKLLKDGPFVLDDEIFAWYLGKRGIKRFVMRTNYPDKSTKLRFNLKHLGLGDGINDPDLSGNMNALTRLCHQRLQNLIGCKPLTLVKPKDIIIERSEERRCLG